MKLNKKINENNIIEDLNFYSVINATITCGLCNCRHSTNAHEYAKIFYHHLGWRVLNNVVLCSKCFKKTTESQSPLIFKKPKTYISV